MVRDTVRAAVMPAPGRPIEIRTFPAPRAEDGGAVLETVASEVCGTDVHLHHGRLAGVPYPLVPGHVACGRLVASDGPVRDIDGAEIPSGTLVTFYDVFGVCGACRACVVDRAPTRCPHRRVYGITASAPDAPLGAWSEAVRLVPGTRVVPLPDGVDALDFLGGGCGLPTGLAAVERAGVRLADTVVVQGSGPVGLNAAIFAQLSGAARVFVIGAPAARLEAARRIGADDACDLTAFPDPARRVAWVRERTGGRGADVVIEASGNPAAVPEGLEMLRDAGTYVVVGHYTDAGETTISPHRHVNRKHATILGCWGYEAAHLHRALALLARYRDRFRWRDLVTREYSLDEAGRALDDMERLAVVKAVIRPGNPRD